MKLDEVLYIKQFPQSFTLSNDIPTAFDIIGMKDFCFYDSLLIVSTVNREGLWSFFSMKNNQELGDFLSQGNGPNEFIQAPYVSKARFFCEENHLFAGIEDFQSGKLYKMDIDKSLQNGELSMSMINDSLPAFLFDFVMMDSVTFFCREIENKQTQQTRYIIREGRRETPDNLKKLNYASIQEGEDFNILSTITKCNVKGDLVVEMPIGLNQINLYSINESFGKTICFGDELDNINKIQNTSRWDRIYTYADLRVYDDFFAALYINEKEKEYQIKRTVLPVIQLFRWDGEALAELKLNRYITAFDIDFVNGYLYTLDRVTDEFYRYEIRDVLKKIRIDTTRLSSNDAVLID